jgi:hypothetical protein
MKYTTPKIAKLVSEASPCHRASLKIGMHIFILPNSYYGFNNEKP